MHNRSPLIKISLVALASAFLSSKTVATSPPDVCARAWQGVAPDDYIWPESDSSNLVGRVDVGVGFSGGASRAFVSALGQVRAFEELELMPQIQYLASVSGGSWFSTLYYYYQAGFEGGATDDVALLCPYTSPENESLTALSELPPGCALAAPTTSFYEVLAAQLAKSIHDPVLHPPRKVWTEAVSRVFLEPWGVQQGTYFSWNTSMVEAIRARNPSLTNATFLVPHSTSRPFPIFVSTLDGPASGADTASSTASKDGHSSLEEPALTERNDDGTAWLGNLAPCNRSFTQFQVTPLYVGQPFVAATTYVAACENENVNPDEVIRRKMNDISSASSDGKSSSSAISSSSSSSECVGAELIQAHGGFLETFAFGSPTPPVDGGLPMNQAASGILTVERPETAFSVADASSVSSWAASAVFEEPGKPSPPFPDAHWAKLKELLVTMPVWPTSPSSSSDGAATSMMVLGDGGNLDNVGLFALLQRRVGNIVLFANTDVPLDPEWNATANPVVQGDEPLKIDAYLSAAFGYQAYKCGPEVFANDQQDTSRNQVFPSESFATLVTALQAAVVAGKGAVATVSLQTIANEWVGVGSGQVVNLTIVYNSMPSQWYNALPADVQEQLALGARGAFPNFPYYSTLGQVKLSAAQGALLADMQSWVIRQHFSPGTYLHNALFH